MIELAKQRGPASRHQKMEHLHYLGTSGLTVLLVLHLTQGKYKIAFICDKVNPPVGASDAKGLYFILILL